MATEEGNKLDKVATELRDPVVSPHNIKHLGVLLLLLVLCYLSYYGVLRSLLDTLFHGHLYAVSHVYLENAGSETEETLLVVSAIKTFLALIESSSGGISFIVDVEVQLGHVVSVMSELIDYAWQVSLVALLGIKIMTLLLEFSKVVVGPLLTLLFILYGLTYAISPHLPRIGNFFRQLAKSGLLIVLFVYMVVPLSIYVTASAGLFVFSEHKSVHHEGFQTLNDRLGQHDHSSSLGHQIKHIIGTFKHTQKSAANDAKGYANLVTSHIIYSLIEYFFLPVLLMAVLALITRSILMRVWPD